MISANPRGARLELAEAEAEASRLELERALDHFRDSLERTEERIDQVKESVSTRVVEAVGKGLAKMDSNPVASWFAVFFSGCVFGALFWSSIRSRGANESAPRLSRMDEGELARQRVDERAADLTDRDIETAA